MSPFLQRLSQELKSARTVHEQGEIQARRAGYLARTGDFEGAKSSILDLRKIFGDGHDGIISIWIIISEALILHFEKVDPSALDRIMRAQLLSKMIGDKKLEAVSSAWKAHIEFEHSKFDAMFESLRAAIAAAKPEDSDAHARISNILCKTATLCGYAEVAKSQFQSGRRYALSEGDQASIEALQHNKAAFRLARIRSMSCIEEIERGELEEVRIEISTAKSLQNLTGIKALSNYIELCQARLLIIEGRFPEAVEALQSTRDVGPFPPGSVTPELIDLDISYCLALMGDVDKALQVIKAVDLSKLPGIDVDEKLVVRWLQMRLATIDSRFGNLREADVNFNEAVDGYNAFISQLQQGMDSLSLK